MLTQLSCGTESLKGADGAAFTSRLLSYRHPETDSALPQGTRGNPRWQSLGPFQEPVRLRSQARAGVAACSS